MKLSHLIHLFFYIIGLIFCLYGLLSEGISNEFIDKLKKQPEKILYFSYNALMLTIIMIFWGILAIFTLPFKQLNHHIKRIHSLNAYITFGSETIVVLVYWPLNYVNNIPDFLLPYKDNHILPPLKQFSIHIFPFIICLIEVFTCRINRGYLKYFGMLLVGIIYNVILIVYIQLYVIYFRSMVFCKVLFI
ncbi:hypothetical protein H311_01539 [Anncaliia algerae PRA109]|nr:hypothetical protein H311_01539 [Anncaliia algerae PRA109]